MRGGWPTPATLVFRKESTVTIVSTGAIVMNNALFIV